MRKDRGRSKKFSAKGRNRYVATEDEIIARNRELGLREDEHSSGEAVLEEGESDAENESDSSSNNDSYDSDSSDVNNKPFEIYNPNRNFQSIEKTGIKELSRREREELERQNFEKNKMASCALAEVRKAREAAMAKKLEKLSLKE
ncbi:hypothetical protein BdWA1_002330 [Babesia duncani]|uniref:Casein kinase substrate phosphoprotein PP28 domain-containing protein n=1 Tax=Babesia duncani TaxID=323732 RepID=A0AAD9PJR1_9APIC|nr:hypothetical protein BdWA1_002330 [Babesia duncani]